MSTANRFTQTGGLDASLQFELTNGENTGPGHGTALKFFANYLSSRSSMADLIAAGTYASVRACGGPAIPLRLGRKDAAAAGNLGVPQPQNSAVTFRQQFDRMGFTPAEMIQVTACGHTLGGVHALEFPDLVPAGTGVNGQIGLDKTVATFDNKVVTEYIDGTTTNPLVVGPAVSVNRHSDFKVFNSDGNATMNAMASPDAFSRVCQTVLQKMIDVVPGGVVLTEPIAPYMVKPVDMKLTLATGNRLLLTGSIRVRTTNMPASSIKNVVLTWKDRSGGNSCGSSTTCSTTNTLQGIATGFDDTFGFFPVSVYIPASDGISSFGLKINLKDGSSQTYDNNGKAYPITDGIIFQKPQSCLLQGSGALTATALVRNDLASLPINLGVSYLTPRNPANENPVPALNNASIVMAKGECAGTYTFYSASFTIPGGLSYNARISVTAGESESVVTDDFNYGGALAGTCSAFAGGTSCSSVITSSAAPTTSSSTQTSSSTLITGSTSSVTAFPTPAKKLAVGGYAFAGCWTEGIRTRALGGAGFAYEGMTLETCMSNCTRFDYWGAEYGRECYCANSLHSSSHAAPEADCNMLCSGDQAEYCGSGNRIELYSTTATRSTAATPTPPQALSIDPTVYLFSFLGCYTEASAGRALTGTSYASSTAMTLEKCAAFCSGFKYFATEYSTECYCGNTVDTSSTEASLGDCSMTCSGNPSQYCGGSSRMQLYAQDGIQVLAPQHPARIGDVWVFDGCRTEAIRARALSRKGTASQSVTLDICAAFCEGFAYFGAEYGVECYCDDGFGAGSVEVAEGECGMLCAGNNAQLCGAGNRLSVYLYSRG